MHFLTYPQCDVPLEEILRQLKLKYGAKYGWAVISHEDHEPREGDVQCGVHRHVQAFCKTRFQTRDSRFWDITYEGQTYHPHYKPTDAKANSKYDVLKYVIKDGQFIQDGMLKDVPFTVELYLESVKTKSGYTFLYMATEIKAGKTMDQLDEICPGHIMNHKRKIQDYIEYQHDKTLRLTIKPKFFGFQNVDNYDWKLVVEWANHNFLHPRELRQDQLWIWSKAPHLGKTYPWAITLRDYFNCYEWIKGDKQSKAILTCDYILIDELKGQLTITELKQLSQMYGINLDIKYGDITFWKKNVPLIITSHRSPRALFHKCNPEDVESLEDRFLVVEVDALQHLVPNPGPEEPRTSIFTEPFTPPHPFTPTMEDSNGDDKEDISEMSEESSDDSVGTILHKRNMKNSKK